MPTRAQLYALLGDLPDRARPISSRLIGEESGANYRLERLMLDLNGEEEVPAFFAHPAQRGRPLPGRPLQPRARRRLRPGKDELLRGTSYLQQPPYAETLAAAGIAALCIDHWGFGERRGPHRVGDLQGDALEGPGHVGHDGLRQLCGGRLPASPGRDVDAARIGDAGHVDGQHDGAGGWPRSTSASRSAWTSAA